MDVKTLCLALLSHGRVTGYEIRKEVEEGLTGYFYHAGYGSIYPALNDLEAKGLIEVSTDQDEGRPSKKMFTLTPKGQDALRASMAGQAQPARYRSDALFQLFFSEYLAQGRAVRVAEAYRAEMIEKQSALSAKGDCGCDHAGQEFVRGLGLAVCEAIIRYIDENKSSLTDVPSTERKAS
ncbi:MAG: PadR family transcriptional regulator [Magnetospiraceae bacterium]